MNQRVVAENGRSRSGLTTFFVLTFALTCPRGSRR